MATTTLNPSFNVSDGFKAMCDPIRLRALEFLLDPDLSDCASGLGVCACDLERILNLKQPTVSHHMKILVGAGLVHAEKHGRWMHYALVPEAFERLSLEIARFASHARTATGARCC